MAADSVNVVPADLVKHAGNVEVVADDLAQAKSAGGGVSVGHDAYGYLCTMLPVMLGFLQDSIVEGIEAARVSLDDTGDRLRAAAHSYTGADSSIASTIDSVYGPR